MNKTLLKDIINKVGDDIEEEYWGNIFAKLDATRLATLFVAFAEADIQPFDVFDVKGGELTLQRLATKIKFLIAGVQRIVRVSNILQYTGRVQQPEIDYTMQLVHYFKIFYIYKNTPIGNEAYDYAFSLVDLSDTICEVASWKLLYKQGE